MEEQLRKIREEAASKFKISNEVVKHPSKDVQNGVIIVNYLFIKNNSYYININGVINKLEDNYVLFGRRPKRTE